MAAVELPLWVGRVADAASPESPAVTVAAAAGQARVAACSRRLAVVAELPAPRSAAGRATLDAGAVRAAFAAAAGSGAGGVSVTLGPAAELAYRPSDGLDAVTVAALPVAPGAADGREVTAVVTRVPADVAAVVDLDDLLAAVALARDLCGADRAATVELRPGRDAVAVRAGGATVLVASDPAGDPIAARLTCAGAEPVEADVGDDEDTDDEEAEDDGD